MNISQKLSWELVALADRGDAHKEQQTALEVCYGVSLAQGDPGSFASTMEAVANQVSDTLLRDYLRFYTARGLKK